MLSVYIHIPFCIRKCLYCDFLSFPAEESTIEAYVEALLEEIETESPKYAAYRVDTVFFGGGTPSVLKAGHIEHILSKLRNCYKFTEDPEITIEVNPGTADRQKFEKYKNAGVNRISIGTQSVHDKELKVLGRIHNASEFFETYRMVREAGFDNVNVDLMSALPGQKAEEYGATLRTVMDLKPEHISAYSLIIEEGTPFFDMYGTDCSGTEQSLCLPTEEEERLMYEETGKVLSKEGYYRYEISNYSLKGKECRHNIAYWKRYNYVGFGLGAASMVENVRWRNTAELQEYLNAFRELKPNGKALKNIKEEIQHLNLNEQMEEFMFLGLRLTEGVSRAEFLKMFCIDMEEVYGTVLKELSEKGLIECSERIKLTQYGRDVSNYVMSHFLF